MSVEPKDLKEYEEKYELSYRTSGHGAGTVLHFPCPFCAAPEWYEVRADQYPTATSPLRCTECNRSARFTLDVNPRDNTQTVELLQVDGPDAPSYLDPAPRRENPEPDVPHSAGHLG